MNNVTPKNESTWTGSFIISVCIMFKFMMLNLSTQHDAVLVCARLIWNMSLDWIIFRLCLRNNICHLHIVYHQNIDYDGFWLFYVELSSGRINAAQSSSLYHKNKRLTRFYPLVINVCVLIYKSSLIHVPSSPLWLQLSSITVYLL